MPNRHAIRRMGLEEWARDIEREHVLNAFRRAVYIRDETDVQCEPLFDTISFTGDVINA